MTRIRTSSLIHVLLVALLATLPLGCGSSGDNGGDQPAPSSDAGSGNTDAPTTPALTGPTVPPTGPTVPPSTPAEPTETPEPADTVVEAARPGMSERVQNLGTSVDPITTPVRTLWSTRERIILMQIENNMKMHKGLNGKYPATFEEFEEKILKPSQLKLPQLPAGQEYFYDAETGELMVKRPR